MIIFGLGTCDTCSKARKALPTAEFVDVRDSGVPSDVLAQAFSNFGEALLNTRSTTWRGLSEAERQGTPLELIGTYPLLMKRPLIVVGDRHYLGWGKDVQAELVG